MDAIDAEIRSFAEKLSVNNMTLILAGASDGHYPLIHQIGLHRAVPSDRVLATLEDAVSVANRMLQSPSRQQHLT